jgi:hypothetical protein
MKLLRVLQVVVLKSKGQKRSKRIRCQNRGWYIILYFCYVYMKAPLNIKILYRQVFSFYCLSLQKPSKNEGTLYTLNKTIVTILERYSNILIIVIFIQKLFVYIIFFFQFTEVDVKQKSIYLYL